MTKKKYYILSSFVLFVLFFAFCSSCYARTTINNDEAEYLINYLFGTEYDTTNVINFLGLNNTGNASKGNFDLDTLTADFISYFNANNTLNFSRNYTIFYNRQYNDYNSTSYNGALYYSNFNNGKSSNYPHLYIRVQPDTSVSRVVGFFAIDDNKNALSNIPLYIIEYSVNNGVLTFTNFRTSTIPTNFSNLYYKWVNYKTDWNHYNFANNSSLIESIPGLVSFSRTNAIYINYNGVNYSNEPYTKLLDTFYVYESEPVTPEDSTGTITNNSGDKTGQIDLSGIVNGIKDVQNQISGDTQRIIDNQNTIAEHQHEDLTSYDTDVADEGINNLLDNIQNTLSGDLNNSEIFGALEEVESGFIDLISGQASDFEIHWSDVYYNGVKLIPAGQVNFSALCRDNSTLGNVKDKLNIILSALCGLAFIKYLYNLFLATLGIDNPYLYDKNENPEVTKSYDVNTGVTTYHGYDKNSKTSWTYRSGGGKNK